MFTIKTAGGNALPYLGYVEITVDVAPKIGKPVDTLALVVSDDKCDSNVPVLVGTNVLKMVCTPLMVNNQVISQSVQRAVRFLSGSLNHSLVGHVKAIKTEELPPKSKTQIFGKQMSRHSFLG